jgi:cytoskeletal protein CcmA (bactofilin family)
MLALVALLALTSTALAYDGRGGERVVIAANEVIEDDLYVSASTFVLQGTVKGDVFAVGQTITIDGTVEGDLVAAGQTVTVNGTVSDDARLAGAAVTLGKGAQIGDDAFAFGSSLEAQSGSAVDGSLLFVGYQALLSGIVSGNATVNGNALEVRGQIGGDIKAEVGSTEQGPSVNPMQFVPNMPAVPSVSGGLTVGEGAQIGGDLRYKAPQEADMPSGTVGGQVRYERLVDETEPSRRTPVQRFGQWFLRNLRRFLALVVVALLLAWLAPAWIVRPAGRLLTDPWPSLGFGAATLFGFPVAMLVFSTVIVLLAILLGLVTLGNLSASVVWLGIATVVALSVAFGLLVAYVAKIVVAYWGGHVVLKSVNPKWAENRFWSVLLGVVLVAILLSIPFVGWLIGLAITLFGLGTLWLVALGMGSAALDQEVVAKVDAQ